MSWMLSSLLAKGLLTAMIAFLFQPGVPHIAVICTGFSTKLGDARYAGCCKTM
jgi:hypothetical protein